MGVFRRRLYDAGDICWATVSGPDPDAVCAFYVAVLGWGTDDIGIRVLTAEGGPVAACASTPSAADRGRWILSVAVSRVERTARRVESAGGTVVEPPHDVGTLGRAALVADPGGAVFGLWQGKDLPGASVAARTGSRHWTVVTVPDMDRALAFYRRALGWTPRNPWHYPEQNVMHRRRVTLERAPEPPFQWVPWFGLDSSRTAAARAVAAGGTAEVTENSPAGNPAHIVDPWGAELVIIDEDHDW